MALPPEFHDLAKKVNNWGRWGDDDEIGTVNLVTPEVIRRAAACVRTGRTFSLAIPLSLDGPQTGYVPGRINPLRTMVTVNTPFTGDPSEFCTSDDIVVMALQAATHWDSLAHVSYDGRLYNGFPAGSVDASGASRCGIDKISTLVSRGVLLDLALAKGVDRLDGGYALTAGDLDAACELARVRVEPGDIVLLRTGQMQLLKRGDKLAYAAPTPGPSTMTVEWFHDHDVAAVATDSLTFEVFPCERKDALLPVHLLHLVEMGMTQGQNFDLDALAADCAGDGVYEFLLDASPQPFVRGLGSPVNPVAVK
ncbi:MAG: cyclase family protein [Actinobacteria bacterium]|nr:MAG: cyclase family protein [Actinomycetota bacterium]